MLLDIRLRDGDGLDLLRELRAGAQRDVPVIVATAYGDSERTIRAMRDGAFDYLTKPFDLPALLATVERAVKQRALRAGARARRRAAPTRAAAWSAPARRCSAIWKLIGRAAASDAPVLITGETGTGKELVARAIHDYSARAARAVRRRQPGGAAADADRERAVRPREGRLHRRRARAAPAASRRRGAARCSSTRSAISIAALQTKLLRVLQDGTLRARRRRRAAHAAARASSRATNKPVRPGEPGGVLREDLYYRLAVIEIEVPPLRARAQRHPAPGRARARAARRRAPSPRRRWRTCSPIAGRATCAS